MTLRLLVSLDPVRGVSVLRDSLQEEYRRTFASASAVRTYLIQLHGMNLRTMTCVYEPAVLHHVRALQSEFPWDIIPIVPNMDRYSRFLQNFGSVGSAIRLLRELAPGDYPALGLRALSVLAERRGTLFSTLISLLAAYDMTQFRHFRPKLALLHSAVTDVLLANGHTAMLRQIIQLIGKHYGVSAGLSTENVGVLLQVVEEQALRVSAIAGPLNRSGYRVKPSLEECLSRLRRTRATIYATLPSPDRAPSLDQLEFLRRIGVAGAVVELPDARDALHVLEAAGSLRGY